MSNLKVAETTVEHLRDRKWELVKILKELGHDFRETMELDTRTIYWSRDNV